MLGAAEWAGSFGFEAEHRSTRATSDRSAIDVVVRT